jgi:hypothetical protein
VINESINLIWILLLKLSFRDVGGYELLQFGMVFVSELFELADNGLVVKFLLYQELINSLL